MTFGFSIIWPWPWVTVTFGFSIIWPWPWVSATLGCSIIWPWPGLSVTIGWSIIWPWPGLSVTFGWSIIWPWPWVSVTFGCSIIWPWPWVSVTLGCSIIWPWPGLSVAFGCSIIWPWPGLSVTFGCTIIWPWPGVLVIFGCSILWSWDVWLCAEFSLNCCGIWTSQDVFWVMWIWPWIKIAVFPSYGLLLLAVFPSRLSMRPGGHWSVPFTFLLLPFIGGVVSAPLPSWEGVGLCVTVTPDSGNSSRGVGVPFSAWISLCLFGWVHWTWCSVIISMACSGCVWTIFFFLQFFLDCVSIVWM